MVTIPRILIGATHSGTGKTSLAVALTAALRRRGLTVQTFKVGPDFLDPTYLARASGRPCYNLDGWMTGKDYVRRLFARAAGDADIAVIEGVMGLFDGADTATAQGSTAEIARWLDAPILLMVDARGASRSIAALVKGYATFEPDTPIMAVIANNCASDNHARWLADSLAQASLPPLAGTLFRDALPGLSGRHLGLHTADEHTLPEATLAQFAQVAEKTLNMEMILNAARNAPPLPRPRPDDTRAAVPRAIPLAVAYDQAFHFYYRDTLDALEARGCRIAFFSPLTDEALPGGAAGLYIGGGYPEIHAADLSANKPMLDAIRSFAASGRPVYAECGGLIYLSQGVETAEGKRYPLAGVIPIATRMRTSKKILGYLEASLNADSLWGKQGDVLRGHEFHYSELVPDALSDHRWQQAYTLKYNRRDASVPEGFLRGRVLASYAHLHYASRPEAVTRFVTMCGGVG